MRDTPPYWNPMGEKNRKTDPQDGKATQVYLTPEARKVLRRLYTEHGLNMRVSIETLLIALGDGRIQFDAEMVRYAREISRRN